MRHRICFGIAIIMIWAGSSIAYGQARRQAKKPPLATLRAEGTVQMVRPGVLIVKTENGEQWAISVPRNIEALEYHGQATAGWLQRGMAVRFHAVLDKRLRAHEDVTSVSVITLRRGIEPGVFPDQEQAASAEAPAVSKIAGAKKKKRIRRSVSTIPCLVIGRLLGIKKRSMMVAAGRTLIEAPLAENATVTVEVNDYRLTRPGDKVEVDARYLPQRRGQAQGERLVITAATPLSPPTKVARRRTERKPKDRTHDNNRK